jgi:2Fe-2S iron-sulfur cluster binding domain
MHTGTGRIIELVLEDGRRLVRISCQPNLIPAPGQYLLASHASDSLLPVPVFYTDSAPDGFIAAPLIPDSWSPGQELHLRGPLGQGFELPGSARKVAMVAFDGLPVRLRGLIKPALQQGAAVVLLCDFASERLPDDVEVQPLSALADVMSWADYMALDAAREKLYTVGEKLGWRNQAHPEQSRRTVLRAVQILVRTLMPCGGIAECGVCAVRLKSGWKLTCKDGPVLDWRKLG